METDLSKITDIDKLKSMAYDFLAQQNAIQSNLQMINRRITQLSVEKEKVEAKK